MRAINCLDGIFTETACLFVESLLANSIQCLENIWLHTTKIWTIRINGACSCAFLIVYTPPIGAYHASIKLDIRRVVEDFFRGGEGRTLVKLAAGSTTLDALPCRIVSFAPEPNAITASALPQSLPLPFTFTNTQTLAVGAAGDFSFNPSKNRHPSLLRLLSDGGELFSLFPHFPHH